MQGFARNYCFTTFGREDEHEGPRPLVWDVFPEWVNYLTYQRERCPETGRIHFQGYLECVGKKSYRQIQAIDGMEGSHLERRHGTQDQAITYANKDDTRVEGPWTYGEAKDQGKRNDLLAIKQELEAGHSMKRIADDHFGNFIRYERAFRSYKRMVTAKRDWAMEIIVYVGPSGTGKTRAAREAYPEAYWKPKGKWWDGYDGEAVVVWDEFYGHCCAFTELLQILDRYPYAVECKGGTLEFVSKTIVLTTNQEPRDWYDAEKTHQVDWALNPLNRRLREFGRIVYTGEVHQCNRTGVSQNLQLSPEKDKEEL